ncbi:patatin-like phospholipase family protein [Roseomonas sp. CCTCC AB2023176]|uniref:patatin-like phospholipase family protein n=1 Tax=Roseomonas sp. CCTCC AB2023176 TaxID=3342640 RepID=UPI0035E0079A
MTQRTTALVLSGGLSLGAYHAGAYAALAEAGGPLPDHVAGCSIGAVTAAVLAGSAPEDRVAALRRLWDALTDALPDLPGAPIPLARALTWSAAARTGLFGRPGLFRPRLNLPSDPFPGLYDLSPLHRFLAETVDFGRLNGGDIRVSLAATDLVSGERVTWDTARGDRIGPDHVVASCALLPLFAPLAVEGRLLGDGGLSCNLPLDLVLGAPPPGDLLVIASDLFPAPGRGPRACSAPWRGQAT